MPLTINLHHLKKKDLHLQGELEVEELDLELHDELIEARLPLKYDLVVRLLDKGVLASGRLGMVLHCECARCLKPFEQKIELRDWVRHLPLVGEDAVAVENDCVDLTPHVREDILLAFPQHPLCDPSCEGLLRQQKDHDSKAAQKGQPPESTTTDWSELNKLEL